MRAAPEPAAAPAASELSLKRFRAPRYWPTWVFFGFLVVTARLPLRVQLVLGRAIGSVLYYCARRRRRIATTNIALCFDEFDAGTRTRLLKAHFDALGMSFFEMAAGWFATRAQLARRVEIRGREHLDAARALGRGVLLITAHFTCLETCVAALERFPGPFAGLYSPQRNAMLDMLIRRGRSRVLGRQLARDNVRGLLRALGEGRIVLYLPDQTYLGNQSMLLPFFGEPAVTNTAVPKLAAISGAAVLTYFFRRLPDGRGYAAEIAPLTDGYPGGDTAADTAELFRRLESAIEQAPEQYLWIYRKFKGRPAELGDPYASPSVPRR